MFKKMAVAFLILSTEFLSAGDSPSAAITNGDIRAKLYLPDAKIGFYRGTRFDWSGVIYSLEYKQHQYYGPWFDRTDPKIHDFIYDGPHIVAGPCSAITGPVDEFQPLGWDQAAAGGSFVKIGVGTLRKPRNGKYDQYELYEIVDSGKRTVQENPDSVEFTQELSDSSSGYGYVYRKNVRLASAGPVMTLEHSLKNTGARAIHTNVYNHNFLVLDQQAPGPGFVITVPFQIRSPRPPNPKLAAIRGNQIVYLSQLEKHDVAATQLEGFRDNTEDHEIRVENSRLGAGLKITANRPLSSESLWSIRTVVAMEPYISITVEPGGEFTWTTTYEYYTLPKDTK
jgi:hypothetical protein